MAQRNHPPRVRRWHVRTPAVLLCLLAARLAQAASGVNVEIHGVNDEVRDNVLAYLSFERYMKSGAELNADTVERLHNRVEREVDSALKPFGYYEPQVRVHRHPGGARGVARASSTSPPGSRCWSITSTCGSRGPAQNDLLFRRILRRLPLKSGDRLNHKAYEDIKSDLQRTAATYGYLDATPGAQRAGRGSPQPHARTSRSSSTPARATASARRPSPRAWCATAWCAATCATRKGSTST